MYCIFFFYSFDNSKPRYTPRILGRRFALTSTAYKYLDIGISVGSATSVELVIGDNRGNQIILSRATWETFIDRRADIERLVQSTIASSVSIRDLVVELVKMRDTYIVKLALHDTYLYMKPSTILFLFELEHCIEHVYFGLYRNIHGVGEKFKQFVAFLRRNCITDKCEAAKILRESVFFDKSSIIDCELLAYALDNIIYNALHDK